jgi:hypothetical protein
MKFPVLESGPAPASLAVSSGEISPSAGSGSLSARGPIEFRFVLQFAPQLSTPFSRGLAIKPRAVSLPLRPPPRMFQRHLQRHSVLQ